MEIEKHMYTKHNLLATATTKVVHDDEQLRRSGDDDQVEEHTYTEHRLNRYIHTIISAQRKCYNTKVVRNGEMNILLFF